MVCDMSTEILLGIEATLLGIGLVFLTVILFWFFKRELKSIFKVAEKNTGAEKDYKKIAAIVAISIALAEKDHHKVSKFPLPPTAIVSAWQAVLRSNILSKRGHIR
jgi:hypothetical protein